MPILWKLLLKKYFFSFAVFLCISVLLSFFGNIQLILSLLKFSSEQTLSFLVFFSSFIETSNLSIGFSSLVASFYTMFYLNSSGFTSSLLPFGIPLKKIKKPLIQTTLILSSLCFILLSEIHPYVQMRIANLRKKSLLNPLALLSNNKITDLSQAFVQMDLDENGKEGKDFFFIQRNALLDRLLLIQAKKISSKPGGIISLTSSSIVSHYPNWTLVENGENSSFYLENILSLEPSQLELSNDLEKFPLTMLLDIGTIPSAVECLRRLSFAFFPFVLSLVGMSIGERTSEKSIKKSVPLLIILFFIPLFFMQAKFDSNQITYQTLAYILPYIFLFSGMTIHRTMFEKSGGLL